MAGEGEQGMEALIVFTPTLFCKKGIREIPGKNLAGWTPTGGSKSTTSHFSYFRFESRSCGGLKKSTKSRLSKNPAAGNIARGNKPAVGNAIYFVLK